MSSPTEMMNDRKQGPITMPAQRTTGGVELFDQASERRVVTIMFCDVAGSTAMAEMLDPEEWADLMNEAFGHLIRPIERYDGTVTRLMGDAVLALFGAPRAHEDDPQRAILAALDIIAGIQGLRERIQSRLGLDFDVRIGINTGLVVVGAFGADELVEYTAMGDAINVAARLTQMAEPGTILVGATTHRLAASYFEFEDLGPNDVRGKREPESIYRVLGAGPATGRRWDADGRDMPFTGRGREMAMLRQAVDELRFEGRGRIITISGEAGIGKTRVVDELIDYVTSLPVDDGGMSIALLENRVNPYEVTRPYAGLQARFRKVFGIEQGDGSDVVREKFLERSRQFPPRFRERAARVIQRVMALDVEGNPGDAGFQPDEFKSELSTVVLQIVRGWNPDGAFMLVGEDYHWGDAASLEIVTHLYALLDERPVLFLCTFRPDADAPFTPILDAVRERYAEHMLEIELLPLAPLDTRDLVNMLIDGDSSAAEDLRQIILSRAEGNPLFVEEIIYTLVEQGHLEPVREHAARWRPAGNADPRVVSIPTTLQALLLERIDHLPPEARRTLQQASVLGRTFSRRVLRGIAEINGSLDGHLDSLMQMDLLRAVDSDAGDELVFRHALIQEAAYNTILHRYRRQFHRRAAETIERVYADRRHEHASEIGDHYFQARDGRGVIWLVRAAEQAQAVYEPDTVVDSATKAIELASDTGAEAPARAMHLRGHAHDMLGRYDAARDDLQAVLDVARSRGDRELEWQALIDLGLAWAERDYSRAGERLRDALELARSLGDDQKLAHSLNRVGNLYVNIGHPRAALDAHQEALVIFKRLNDRDGLAEALDLRGLASYLTADFSASAASYRQAIEIFRERGDSRGLASSLAMLAASGGGFDRETVMPAAGQPDEWLGYAREALEITRGIGWRAGEAFALIVTGTVNANLGDLGRAIESLRRALEIAREIGHRQWSLAASQELGVIALDILNDADALALLTEALGSARELGSAFWSASAASNLADLHIAAGDIDHAEAILSSVFEADGALDSVGQRKLIYRQARLALARGEWAEALSVADRLVATAPGWQPGDVIPALSLIRGEALSRLGRLEAAVSDLLAAQARAVELHDRSMLWRLHLALACVFRTQGDEQGISRELDAARGVIALIAKRVTNDRWRKTFLARSAELLTTVGEDHWPESV